MLICLNYIKDQSWYPDLLGRGTIRPLTNGCLSLHPVLLTAFHAIQSLPFVILSASGPFNRLLSVAGEGAVTSALLIWPHLPFCLHGAVLGSCLPSELHPSSPVVGDRVISCSDRP